MRIEEVLLAPGLGGFYYDDEAAIRGGAASDGFVYSGPAVTAGFEAVRQPATVLSIGLRLSDGTIAWGDAMSVQYSGAAGRDSLFGVSQASDFVRASIAPRLVGRPVASFRQLCRDALSILADGTSPPRAVAYGVSQALLRAVAAERRLTMAEVVCEEFDLPTVCRPVPIFAQSGDIRHDNVDKMILKQVAVLPHGLINSREKFGAQGAVFRDYLRWTVGRLRRLGAVDFRPTLHFDLYGMAGLEFGLDIEAIADFVAAAGDDAGGLALNLESPADFLVPDAHIAAYAELVAALRRKGSAVRLVVDEHCNTLQDIEAFAEAGAGHILQIKTPDVGSLEDIIAAVGVCRAHGLGAYLGGSCAETDLSARACVHVAVATQADMMLAKPGMGVDEGLSIVGNEQARLLASLAARTRAEATRP